MIDRVIRAKCHWFGKNIDTDQIYPGKYLDLTDHKEIASHCMEGASDLFSKEFVEGDIIAADSNFGCGSSREHAAIALKVRGVSAVISKSFGRIFYRNAINMGLPLIVCAEIDKVAEHGEELIIDLDAKTVINANTGNQATIEPISDYAMQILNAGGIKALLNQK
jgi:3-isopropylmalate/(R)-2-methylmalate dehydratase small subunit